MSENTIAELFARDPLTYTQQDIQTIVEKMREARKNFQLGGKAAAKEPKKVDLKDLGLL